MGDPSDMELIARARAGDRQAFGSLIRLHQSRVYACAVRMLGNRSEADDVAQETFLRAFRAIDRFDGRSELSTWLYRICVNLCLNAIRSRKRKGSEDIDDPRIPEPKADAESSDADPRLALERAQTYSRLAKAIEALSPTLRTTIVLVCIEGVPQKQVAETLGCSEGTVAWRVHEARSKLREALQDGFMDGDDLSLALAGGKR
jgi:RNA polymerase sigma-70 factor (ECF subfamily)